MLFNELKQYKTEKRPQKRPSDASVRTDINNILYVESLRTKNSTTLWQINDFLVSADQILTNWARNEFAGVPTVMIPSIWLSIILKVAGRTSSDDYKSYCLFMSLRHHRTEDDEININPVFLLSKLAQKTVESNIKEKVINEILTNKMKYTFESESEYDQSIDKAFDRVLEDEKTHHKEELKQAVEEQAQEYRNELGEYEKELARRKTDEEYAKRYALNKSQKKVGKYAKHENLRLLFIGLFLLTAIIIVASFVFKLQPLYGLLIGITASGKPSTLVWSGVTWLFTALTGTISGYFSAVWKYLGSNGRKSKLYDKYYEDQLKNIKQDK